MAFTKDEREIVFTILIAIFFMIVLPAFGLTLGRGLTDRAIFDKNVIYYGWGLAGLIAVIAIKFAEVRLKGDRAGLRKYGWLNAQIHDPEDGLPFVQRFRIFAHPGKLYLVSFVFFGFLMLVMTGVFQTGFVGVPLTEFQVTETAQILFGQEPAATAETFLFLALALIQLNVLRWGLLRAGLPAWVYFVLAIVVVAPLMGVEWLGWHNLRYGFDQAAQVNVFFFGTTGTIFLILFGSVIPWLVWHQQNNLFLKAIEVAGQLPVLVVGGLVLSLILIVLSMYMLATRKQARDVVGSAVF